MVTLATLSWGLTRVVHSAAISNELVNQPLVSNGNLSTWGMQACGDDLLSMDNILLAKLFPV
jgi:hypothetical protein